MLADGEICSRVLSSKLVRVRFEPTTFQSLVLNIDHYTTRAKSLNKISPIRISGQRQRPTLRAADHQWFKMDKIETRDGDDAVAICSWDGMTHIIDRNFQSAAYNFGENICGFCAGSYCVEARKNVPCFCYVTFANRIILFYDLKIALEKPKSLDVVLVEKLKGRIGMEGVLAALSDSTGNIDHHKVLKLLQNVS